MRRRNYGPLRDGLEMPERNFRRFQDVFFQNSERQLAD